jgi:hypothetical protein
MGGEGVCTFTKLPGEGSALANGMKVTAAQDITASTSAILLMPIPILWRAVMLLARRMVTNSVEAALYVVIGVKRRVCQLSPREAALAGELGT